MKNVVLATCPDDESILTSNLEDKLQSISPTYSTSAVKISGITGLRIDIEVTNNNKSFTLCFDDVNTNGLASNTVYINGIDECDLQFAAGLPCFC